MIKQLLQFFRKKSKVPKEMSKPEYDTMRAFYTANIHSDKPIHFYIEGTEKPKFPPDRIEIH